MIHPRQTLTFDDFCDLPGPAIALDGYVDGPPCQDDSRTHANFDHHLGVDRWSTPATCQQVAAAIRAGLDLVVTTDAQPLDDLKVHVNDPDPDVALSWWLLNHPHLCDHPAVRWLFDLEGRLDASGGTDPGVDRELLEVLAWVIDPWARRRRAIPTLDASAMADIIDEVGARVDEFVAGRPGVVELSTSYELLHDAGPVWAICEHHPLSRATAVADGARVLVSVLPGPQPTSGAVTICKAHPDVPVDLELVFADLNVREHLLPSAPDRWGGSDTVGGSPRHAGTHLTVGAIVAAVLERYGDDRQASPPPIRY
jgi:hypothetical protein